MCTPVNCVHVVVEPSNLLGILGGHNLQALLSVSFVIHQVALFVVLVIHVPGLALLVHVLLQVSALSVVVNEHAGEQFFHLLLLLQNSLGIKDVDVRQEDGGGEYLVERLEDRRSREQDGQSQPQDQPAHPLAGFYKQQNFD